MRCAECPFYGYRPGAKEPECLVNTHLTDDYPLPCIEELEEGEESNEM